MDEQGHEDEGVVLLGFTWPERHRGLQLSPLVFLHIMEATDHKLNVCIQSTIERLEIYISKGSSTDSNDGAGVYTQS